MLCTNVLLVHYPSSLEGSGTCAFLFPESGSISSFAGPNSNSTGHLTRAGGSAPCRICSAEPLFASKSQSYTLLCSSSYPSTREGGTLDIARAPHLSFFPFQVFWGTNQYRGIPRSRGRHLLLQRGNKGEVTVGCTLEVGTGTPRKHWRPQNPQLCLCLNRDISVPVH